MANTIGIIISLIIIFVAIVIGIITYGVVLKFWIGAPGSLDDEIGGPIIVLSIVIFLSGIYFLVKSARN